MRPKNLTSRIAAALAVVLPAAAVALIGAPANAAPAGPNPWDGLVDAATQRLLTADPVAVAKWYSHQSINDPAREQQVLVAADAQAVRLGLDRGHVHRIFRDQLDATKDVESARIAAWRSDPASVPPAGSSLATVRGRIDALNHIMVERIAATAAAAHRPGCRADVAAATTAAAVRYRLDPVAARALRRATGDYCA